MNVVWFATSVDRPILAAICRFCDSFLEGGYTSDSSGSSESPQIGCL